MEKEEEVNSKAAVEIVPNPSVEFVSTTSLSALDSMNEADSFLEQEESPESTNQSAPAQRSESPENTQPADSVDTNSVDDDSDKGGEDLTKQEVSVESNNDENRSVSETLENDKVDEEEGSEDKDEEFVGVESVVIESMESEGDGESSALEGEPLDNSKTEEGEEHDASLSVSTSDEQINGDLLQHSSQNYPPVELFDESVTAPVTNQAGPSNLLSDEEIEGSPSLESKRQRKASHKVIEMAETVFTMSTPVTKTKKGSASSKKSSGKGKGNKNATSLGGTKKSGIVTPRKEEAGDGVTAGNQQQSPITPKNRDENYATLPNGWGVKAVQRMSGSSVGKYDIYYFSPEGKKFRSRNEIRHWYETKGIGIDVDQFEFNANALTTKGILELKNINRQKPKTPLKPKEGGGVTKASQKVIKKKKQASNFASAISLGDGKGGQSPLQKLVIKMPFGGGFGKARMTKKESSQIRSYFAPTEDDVYNFDHVSENESEGGLLIHENKAASREEVFTKVVNKKMSKKKTPQPKTSPKKTVPPPPSPEKKVGSVKKKKGVKRTGETAFGSDDETRPPAVKTVSSPVKTVSSPVKKKKKLGAKKKLNVSKTEANAGQVGDGHALLSDDDGNLNTSQVGDDSSLVHMSASLVDEADSVNDAETLFENLNASVESAADSCLETSGLDMMDTSQVSNVDTKADNALPVKRKRGRPGKKKKVNEAATVKEEETAKKEEVSWEDYQKQIAGLGDGGDADNLRKSEPEKSGDSLENGITKGGYEPATMEEEEIKEEEEEQEAELSSKEILADAREYTKVPLEITADYILNNTSNASKNNRSVKKACPVPIITTRPKSKREEKWIPPHSPFCLVQESLSHDPWKLLVATILLSKSTGIPTSRQIIPILWKLLNRWQTPELARQADLEEMADILFPLGLNYSRAETIIQFSDEFLRKKWTYPIELHGVSKYGNDSYRIFCIDEWKKVEPADQKLTDYQHWLMANQKQLGLV